MPRLPLILAASLTTLAAGTATAEPGIDITIYADNQALVQDTRTVTFTGAPQKVEFRNVSAQIRPETATLASKDLHIIEQNFDYDLLSPAKIMENAVGQTITLVRTHPVTGAETREQAVVLAANGGVVLQIGNRIEVLRDDGLPVRVIFDKAAPNKRADPTLSMTLQGAAGTREASLRYLTPGLGGRTMSRCSMRAPKATTPTPRLARKTASRFSSASCRRTAAGPCATQFAGSERLDSPRNGEDLRRPREPACQTLPNR